MSKAKKKGVKVNLADFMGADSRDALPTAPSGLAEVPRGPGGGGAWRGSAGGARNGDLPRGPRRDRGGDEDGGEEEEWRRFQKGKPSEEEGPSRADEADQWRRGPSASSSSSSSSGTYQARGGSRYGGGGGDREEMGERRQRGGGFGDREREREPRQRDEDGTAPTARADEASEWRRSGPVESDRPSRFGSGVGRDGPRDRDRDRDGPRGGDGPRDGGDRPRYGDRSSHFSSSRESTGGGEREFSRDMFGTAKVEEQRPRFGDREGGSRFGDREGGSRFGSSFGGRDRDRDRDRDHHGREERSERPRLNLQKRSVLSDGSESKSESQATSQAATPAAGTPPSEAADEKPEAAKPTESTPETAKENIKEQSKDLSDTSSKPKSRTDLFGRNIDEPKMTAAGGPALAPIPGRALKKHVDPSNITATPTTRADPFGAARRTEEPKKITKPTEPTPAPKPHIPREVDESLVKEAVPIAQKRSALQKAMNDSEPVTEKQLNEGLARLDLTDTDIYVDLINCLIRSITDKKIAMSLETVYTSLSQHQKDEQADIMCDVLVALRTKKDREIMLNWIKSSPKTPILPIIAGDRQDADLDAFLTSKDLIELKPVPDLTDAIVAALNDNKSSDAVVSQINSSADEKVSVDYLISPVVSFLSSRIYADKSKPDATSVTTYASLLKRVAGSELSHQKRLLYEFQLHWNNAGTPKTILKETFNALLTSKLVPIDAFIAWKEDTSDKGKNGKTKALLQVNSWIEEHTPKPKEEEEDEDEEEDDEDGYLTNQNYDD